MKKEVLILALFLLFTIPIVLAEDNVTDSQKINKAYTCLNNKIQDKGCSQLSLEEKIFSALAAGKCKTELQTDSQNMQCWPKSNCNIKNTAQAILALSNPTAAENWLLSKNISTFGMNWYLEIDSNDPTTCTITYGDSPNTISISEDKKISSSAGGCLSLAQDNYWLRVSESCYGETFEVKCDKSFLATFLFKKENSDTIHVLKETKTASGGGTIDMKIKSSCFSTGSTCDYEGTLWAALALNYMGEDTDAYTPYLLTLAEDYQEFLPEAFIYYLTDYADAKSELLAKQKTGYWEESGDKFYDTAIALYPFQSESFDGKTEAIDWLFSQQDSAGCWQENIRNTAFILYSVFPRTIPGTTNRSDCEDSGYFCMSSISCDGNVLDNYECGGLLRCCDKEEEILTCSELSGSICTSNQECSGTENQASDLDTGEICCIGTCQDNSTNSESTCEANGGTCEAFGCDDTQTETTDTCEWGDTCCVKNKSGFGGSLWIWILLILIVLVVIGFFFKNKLRMFWMQINSKSRKGKSSSSSSFSPRGPPGFPITRMPSSTMRPPQRRILPPPRQIFPRRSVPTKSSSEMDEVLKKLKEMGK